MPCWLQILRSIVLVVSENMWIFFQKWRKNNIEFRFFMKHDLLIMIMIDWLIDWLIDWSIDWLVG
jgi:hypothetical protein